MTFAYTVSLSDPNGIANDNLILANARAALDAWGRYLGGRGTIEVAITLDATDGGSGELAEAGSNTAQSIGRDGARTLYQLGAPYELSTGQDPNGGASDVSIAFNPANLPRIFFNSTPGTGTTPRSQYDGLTILIHELGHAFGVDGFRSDTGVLAARSESAWDKLTVVSGNSASFTGGYATALYGAPPPVTTLTNGEAYYHLGNAASDPASADVLGGTGLAAGRAFVISPLDIAIMADIGTPLSGKGTIDLAYVTALRLKSFADITPAAAATLAGLAAQTDAGLPLSAVAPAIVQMAAATTSVATMAYEFFTGAVPSGPGFDFLVSPEGPNGNNLNSTYYQAFSLENRYINFAVNLGNLGAGKALFASRYTSLTLTQVVGAAYTEIFGVAPGSGQLNAMVNDAVPNGLGGTQTRAQYFASYGKDDLGTKAAAVGWLLAEAVKADTGTYAKANDDFLVKLMGGVALFGTDIVGVHHYLG